MVDQKKEYVQASQPKADGFKIKGKLKGSIKEVADVLRTISFLQVAQEREAVNAIYVESRDINKVPYLFSIIKIKEDELEATYTIPPEISPKKRRLDIIRYVLNILSLIEPYYEIDNKLIYQIIENAVKEIAETVTLEYSKLYTAYDTLKKEVEDLKKKSIRLGEENEALSNRNYELKSKNDELSLRVKELEALSEDVLKGKLQEWIFEHNGEINISEFSKVHNVGEPRVEEILNRLMSEGYIEIVE